MELAFKPSRKVCAALTSMTSLWRTYSNAACEKSKVESLKELLPHLQLSDCPECLLSLVRQVIVGMPSFVTR